LLVTRPENGRAQLVCASSWKGNCGESTRFHFPILTFKPALAGSLADEKSEAFEYPRIVAEIVAQEDEVLVIGRRDAPSFGEETWLTQKNRGVTAEVNIEERARRR
jgi:hypothetical protein